MNIDYKDQKVGVSLAMSPMGLGTSVSLMFTVKVVGEDGTFSEQIVGTKVIAPANSSETDLNFISKIEKVVQEFADTLS